MSRIKLMCPGDPRFSVVNGQLLFQGHIVNDLSLAFAESWWTELFCTLKPHAFDFDNKLNFAKKQMQSFHEVIWEQGALEKSFVVPHNGFFNHE